MGAFWITSIAFLTTGMILTIVAAETQSQDVILLAIAFTFVAAVCALIASRRDRSKIDVTCMECGARKHIDPMNGLPWCECETKRDPWPAVPYRDAFEERMIEKWTDREILEELLRRNEIVPREAPMENGRIGLWLDDYKHPKYEGHSDIRLVFDENGSLVSFGGGGLKEGVMGRHDYCAYCGDCRCETPRDCVAAAVRERDEARAKLPVLTAFITGCRYCGAWAAETGCADCLLTQRDTARAELEEWKRDAIGKLTAVLDAACSERDEAIAEAERLRAVFEVIIAGKIVADPWSITSMLAKERDKIRVERDEAQKAAETYHEAWQDAAVYWKDKVQHLRAEWHEFQRKHPRFSR